VPACLERQHSIRSWLAGWLVAWSALAWSAGARAQAIEVTRDDGCITEAGLRAAMRRYAARVAPDPRLRVTVRPGESALSFELLRDDSVLAERSFETVPPRCTERVRVVAIAIALAFESVQAQGDAALSTSSALASTGAPAPASTGAPAPTSSPPAPPAQEAATSAPEIPAKLDDAPPPSPDQPVAPASEDQAPEPAAMSAGAVSVTLQAGGGVLLGVLPEPALVLSLGAGFALGELWRLELVGLAAPGVTTELSDGVVDAQLYGGQGSLCAGMPLGALRAAGCAGLAAAAVPARGRNFAVSARGTLTGWAAILLAATLDFPVVEPISLRIYAGLYGSLIRPTLEARVGDERRDATSFPIGSVLSVHVLWTLP